MDKYVFVGPVISFALMCQRESRISREKYIRLARSKSDRKHDLEMAAMHKKFEKAWEVTYLEEIAE